MGIDYITIISVVDTIDKFEGNKNMAARQAVRLLPSKDEFAEIIGSKIYDLKVTLDSYAEFLVKIKVDLNDIHKQMENVLNAVLEPYRQIQGVNVTKQPLDKRSTIEFPTGLTFTYLVQSNPMDVYGGLEIVMMVR